MRLQSFKMWKCLQPTGRNIQQSRRKYLQQSLNWCVILTSVLILGLSSISPRAEALHVEGTWETDTFFIFLSKFGFQKTEFNSKNDTQGYIFGNITSTSAKYNTASISSSKRLVKREKESDSVISISVSSSTPPPSQQIKPSSSISSTLNSSSTKTPISSGSSSTTSTTTSTTPRPATPVPVKVTSGPTRPSSSSTRTTSKATAAPLPVPPPQPKIYPATLVVLDRGYFVDFYKSRNNPDKNAACVEMFEKISHVAYDPICYPKGTEKFFKRIPCPVGDLCPDDSGNSSYVVKDHQFTFAISDPNQPKFWYVSLVACYLDPTTCEWKYSGENVVTKYDIWLVNGNPYTKNQNPFEYQFSFDRQDTVEVYIIFFLCYLVLFPLQIHAVLRQGHIVPRLFTGSVTLELTAVLANVIHVLKFSVNGVGHPSLAAFGDIMDIAARALFMLILLVLAKGWAVTRTELTSKPFIFTIWTVYGVVHILLYVWKETEVDVIEDIDEYQTWPGWLILVLRNIIMIWFLYELKDTMDHEHQPHKLNFFLHFGAASLVWFIYLPIIALIALQVTPLWRSKLLLGITYSADCLAFAVMTHLLWPTRSQQYFLLSAKDSSLTDELEEFNEAPHVVNSYSRRSTLRHSPFTFHDASESMSLNNPNYLSNHENGFSNGSISSYNDDYKDNQPLIIT